MNRYLVEETRKNGGKSLLSIKARNAQQAITKHKALCFFGSRFVGYGYCLEQYVNSSIKILK